jgi:hypothetical protein
MAIDGLDAAKTGLAANASKMPNAVAARTHARAHSAREIRNTMFRFDSMHLTA